MPDTHLPTGGGERPDKDGQFLVGYDRAVTRQDYLAFTSALGFGDDRNEPAATPSEILDPIQAAFLAAGDHQGCPEWCDDCDQWERPRSCERCHGSGCVPGTTTGTYDPCADCDADGSNHLPYTLTGTWRGAALAAGQAIAALHPRVQVECYFDDHPPRCTCLDHGRNDYCGTCEGHPRWPCPTAALAAEPVPPTVGQP